MCFNFSLQLMIINHSILYNDIYRKHDLHRTLCYLTDTKNKATQKEAYSLKLRISI